MISRIKASWAGALGLDIFQASGLVHIPRNFKYRVNRSLRREERDVLPDLFHRASYICKVATKSYGDRQRGFGCSRG